MQSQSKLKISCLASNNTEQLSELLSELMEVDFVLPLSIDFQVIRHHIFVQVNRHYLAEEFVVLNS